MDEAVIKFYRNLLRTRFEHAGSFENPSIMLDTLGGKGQLCGNSGDFMQLYLKVADNRIIDIKYNCVCDPTANVAVEILCSLVKGKTLDEVDVLNEQGFFDFLGSRSDEFTKKVRGLLEFLGKGINQYRRQTAEVIKD